mmetsp:Transcript_112963/g.300090  ORF Transcript_112963/g.300090 Transcript_112963/m.300090 type:complete len:210 (+) Transcript_112963:432-1061(+)
MRTRAGRPRPPWRPWSLWTRSTLCAATAAKCLRPLTARPPGGDCSCASSTPRTHRMRSAHTSRSCAWSGLPRAEQATAPSLPTTQSLERSSAPSLTPSRRRPRRSCCSLMLSARWTLRRPLPSPCSSCSRSLAAAAGSQTCSAGWSREMQWTLRASWRRSSTLLERPQRCLCCQHIGASSSKRTFRPVPSGKGSATSCPDTSRRCARST